MPVDFGLQLQKDCAKADGHPVHDDEFARDIDVAGLMEPGDDALGLGSAPNLAPVKAPSLLGLSLMMGSKRKAAQRLSAATASLARCLNRQD